MLGAWYSFELWLIWLVSLASIPLYPLFVFFFFFSQSLLSLLCAFTVVLRAGHLLIIIATRLRHLFNIDATALNSDRPSALDSHFADVALGRLLFLLLNHHRSLL